MTGVECGEFNVVKLTSIKTLVVVCHAFTLYSSVKLIPFSFLKSYFFK